MAQMPGTTAGSSAGDSHPEIALRHWSGNQCVASGHAASRDVLGCRDRLMCASHRVAEVVRISSWPLRGDRVGVRHARTLSVLYARCPAPEPDASRLQISLGPDRKSRLHADVSAVGSVPAMAIS